MIYFEAAAWREAEGGGTRGREGGGKVVVVVEEEEMLCDSLRRVLEALIAGPWEG
jgi:hypothetical protein